MGIKHPSENIILKYKKCKLFGSKGKTKKLKIN